MPEVRTVRDRTVDKILRLACQSMRPYVVCAACARSHASSGRNMSPARRKTAKAKMYPHEKTLIRAGLLKATRITEAQWRKIAKLTSAEVKALVSVRRKLGKGTRRGWFEIL
jgi:hypothetical protein